MGFFVALQFLTVLPPLIRREIGGRELGDSLGYFPLVGLLLGLVLVGMDLVLTPVFPPSLRNGLLVVALAILTGGLHLDGLADTCDGLFGHGSPEARLAIMRDSHLGTFGVLGLVVVLLLKYLSLNALPSPWRVGGLATMACFGRWAMVYAIAAFPYARTSGMGRAFKEQASLRSLLVASGIAAIVGVFFWWSYGGLLLLVVAGVYTWLAARFSTAQIGGLTGDVYGAIAETSEVVVLLVLVALGNLQ